MVSTPDAGSSGGRRKSWSVFTVAIARKVGGSGIGTVQSLRAGSEPGSADGVDGLGVVGVTMSL